MSLQPRSALFLQPHYDDVALSCGATVARWSAEGHAAHIVTVFASELVHGMVGEFAARKHARWRIEEPDQVQEVRRTEDLLAASVLGCDLRWLGLPDAIYRGDRYASDASLYGPIHPEEAAFPDHLAQELLGLPEWTEGMQVFVPLAVGDHVDHQLVFETGRRLAAQGVEVWAYEDLPYGIHTPAGLDRRLERLGSAVGDPQVVDAARYLPTKLEAISAYGSQLPVIFRFTDSYRDAVADHALHVGGGAPAERFWRVWPVETGD